MTQTKRTYCDKMRAQLIALKAQIERLAEAIQRDAPADDWLRFGYAAHIRTLRARQGAMQERLKQIDEADGDTWERHKADLEATWEALKQAVEVAASRMPPGGGTPR